jgi:hypothetical protein
MAAGSTRRDPAQGMHVVAVQHAVPHQAGRPRLDDDWVRDLAEAVGVTFYELRTRLRVLDGWPGVLSIHAGAEPAQRVAHALVEGGIRAWVLPGERTDPRVRVRRFSLQGGWLTVEADGGVQLEIPATDVRMLVHGVQIGEDREVTLLRTPVSSLSRAAMWATPSLGLARPRTRGRTTREPFVELHAPGVPISSFRAGSLRYAALDDGVLEPTRVANFQRVVQTLRTGCSRATYDARMRGRIEQMRVLGPSLRPDKYLPLALTLITGARPDPSPYR